MPETLEHIASTDRLKTDFPHGWRMEGWLGQFASMAEPTCYCPGGWRVLNAIAVPNCDAVAFASATSGGPSSESVGSESSAPCTSSSRGSV